MTSKKKFHVPFFNNPSKDSSRRRNIPRRNTIWSDTVDEELVACLSPRELNRQEVVFEIIKTEFEYVRDLHFIEELFINPIKQFGDKYRERIIPENLNKVFNSISYFSFIHETISNTLNERQEFQFPLVRSISDIFLTYVCAYAPYIIHYEAALRELDECIRKSDKLGRMSNLLKGTDKEGFDYDNTVSLKSKVDEVLSDVEEQKRHHDNMWRLRELETRIQGLGPFSLAINNRQLLREGPALHNSITLKKQPSLRKSLTEISSAEKLYFEF